MGTSYPSGRGAAAGVFLLLATTAWPALADLVVSGAPTSGVVCSADLCEPTTAEAVLNVGDLQSLLAAGDVMLTTSGSGVQARSIAIKADLTWSTSSRLTLQAYHAVFVQRPVRIAGLGGLSVTTNGDGTGAMLSFPGAGRVAFSDVASSLTINNAAYMLVSSVNELAKRVSANRTGNYALMQDEDLSPHTYGSTAIPGIVYGQLNGLGNTISNFNLYDDGHVSDQGDGLFGGTGYNASIASFRLSNVNVTLIHSRSGAVGGLIASNAGLLFDDFVSGTIVGDNAQAGGIMGEGRGTVRDCHSSAAVTGAQAGGIAGYAGFITGSSASGTVTASRTKNSMADAGGLVGYLDGTIEQSYATGRVSGGQMSTVGGLVGDATDAEIRNSYAMGEVTGNAASHIGGFVGSGGHHYRMAYSTTRVPRPFGGGFSGNVYSRYFHVYWDKQTSGQDHGLPNGHDAVGRLRGLTSAKLKVALPLGFDPSVWGQSPTINDGYPYLLENPPQ